MLKGLPVPDTDTPNLLPIPMRQDFGLAEILPSSKRGSDPSRSGEQQTNV